MRRSSLAVADEHASCDGRHEAIGKSRLVHEGVRRAVVGRARASDRKAYLFNERGDVEESRTRDAQAQGGSALS